MNKLRWLILLVGCFMLSNGVYAATVAVVEVVQKEVTLQRAGKSQPVTKGLELQDADSITTGKEARVLIRLADQSIVRLGENAQTTVDRLLLLSDQEGKTLTGTLSVVKGYFRYTSQTAGKRELQVRVGNAATIGVRGTDVFAAADSSKNLVCLISGKVTVQAGDINAELNQPRHFFVVPKDKEPLPVGFVDEEKFQKWIKETE